MNPELKWEVFYPHPPLQVWQALTDPAALSEWLQPGGRRRLPCSRSRGAKERFVFLDYANCDAIVTFELRAVDDGTKLRLRMDERKAIEARMHLTLEWLRSYLEQAVVDTFGHTLVFVAAHQSRRS
jgi:uncharacterized protein YndB with AHSA1/START domain